MRLRIDARLLLVFAMAGSLGCATKPLGIETPTGEVGPDLFAGLQILGVSRRVTATFNRPNGIGVYSDTITVDAPLGTELIVPALQGWKLAYGRVEPDTLAGHTAAGTWRDADHHYGFGMVNVLVLDISSPDFSAEPPTQEAIIQFRAWLVDDNQDDRWFGTATYTLWFLKRAAQPPLSSTEYQILGSTEGTAATLNQTSGHEPFKQELSIPVPVGTQLVVPIVQGWDAAYGRVKPDTLAGHTAGGTWNDADHHYGLGLVDVRAVEVKSPDFSTSPPTQTAELEIQLSLVDDNQDDRWFSTVRYALVFLRLVEQPFLAASGYEIAGFSQRATASLNQNDGQAIFQETGPTQVPVGTDVVVPAMQGWYLAYGKLDPDTLEGHTTGGTWRATDHHFGRGLVDVRTLGISAPDLGASPPAQAADISTRLWLVDDNQKDRWFGAVFYGLFFLKELGPEVFAEPG